MALEFQKYEIGYATIIWIFRKITADYRVVLLFIYSAIFVILVKYVKHIIWNRYSILSIFLLLALIINSFNTLRVILAVFIGMVVYISLYQEKYKRAVLLSIIAITIHVSALILLPVTFIFILINNRRYISFKRLVSYVLIGTLLSVIVLRIANPFITNSKYYVYGNENGIAIQTYIMILIVFVVSL